MAVFEYKVHLAQREDTIETGTVVAADENEAIRKLKAYELPNPKLRRIKGFSGILKKFTANIK